MNRLAKATGRIAATVAASALLASAFAAARPPTQDPAKADEGGKVVPAPAKPAARRALVPAPPPIAGVAARPANIELATRKLIQQFRPILRAELMVLTSAAGPSPAQRREVAMVAGRYLKELARNRAWNGTIPGNRGVDEVRFQIRAALVAASGSRLSAGQVAGYIKELEEKERDRREAVVLNLVANLDRLLTLGVEQRERLRESFLSGWDDRDYPLVEESIIYDSFFPSVPDRQILPILSEEQEAIWKGVRKINFSAVRAGDGLGDATPADPGGEEDDPDVEAALAEDAKP